MFSVMRLLYHATGLVKATIDTYREYYLRSLHCPPISESNFPLKSAQFCKQSSCNEGRSIISIDESSSLPQSTFKVLRYGFGGNKGLIISIDGAISFNIKPLTKITSIFLKLRVTTKNQTQHNSNTKVLLTKL